MRMVDNFAADVSVCVLLRVEHLAHLFLALLLVLRVKQLDDNVVLIVRKHLLCLRLREQGCLLLGLGNSL